MSSILTIIWLISLSISSSAAQLDLNSRTFHEKDQTANIPKLTSIQTVYGDVYDCIDVYKQHSLTHPALRDHKIKMRPSREILAAFSSQRNKSKSSFVNMLWKSKKGCPKGTIPIRRTTNDHMNLTNNSWDHSLSHSGNGIDFAGIYTKPGKKFYTVAAYINVQNPKLHSGGQYSSAVIFVEGGGNQIQAGWTVNPTLYGDYQTRFYSGWTRDNYQSTGCFNVKCPGFIIVDHTIPLDYVCKDISKPQGQQYELPIVISLEAGVGWWLGAGPARKFIGYWPVKLFNSIQDHADSLRLGGQVFTPPSDDVRPQMGSGKFVNGQYDKTCYMRRVGIIDDTRVKVITDIDNSYVSGTESRCFYAGDNSFKNEINRYSFVFGGRGGKDEHGCEF